MLWFDFRFVSLCTSVAVYEYVQHGRPGRARRVDVSGSSGAGFGGGLDGGVSYKGRNLTFPFLALSGAERRGGEFLSTLTFGPIEFVVKP